MDINQTARALAADFVRQLVDALPPVPHLAPMDHDTPAGGHSARDWRCTLDLTDPTQQPHHVVTLGDQAIRYGITTRILEQMPGVPHLVRVAEQTPHSETPE